MNSLLKHVKNGNIIRITQGRERFVAIVNSIPKYIIQDNPHFRATPKRGKPALKDVINVSTQFSNHLSSVLQRKHLKEINLEIDSIQVGFVTIDEYREIGEHIYKPDISSEVRSYYESQKENNIKFIKRVLKAEGNHAIRSSMCKRPSDNVDDFNPKVLTVDYETELNRKEIQRKAKRQLMLKKAKNMKKDPIEQYKNKQKLERRKQQRAHRNVNPNLFK